MLASSLAMAVAAIGTSPHTFSSISIDHLSLHLFLFKAKHIKATLKIKPFVNCSSFFRSPTSSDFESFEFNQEEEEDPQSNADEIVSEVEEDNNEVSQSAEAGRLYVGNLPFPMTSTQLSAIFEEAGRVVSVEIVYDRVTDRSRGFGFVTMATADEAKEAIRLFDGAQIGGRSAKVNFPEVPRGGEREVIRPKIRSINQSFVDSSHKIYAGNLSWSLTSQRLREIFADFPGYLGAKVIYDKDTGRSRGFGFITFSSGEEVNSALNAMNGAEIEGRPLRLNVAEQRAPAPAPASQPAADENESTDYLQDSQMLSSVGS